jgi:AraC family transcriptional regulator
MIESTPLSFGQSLRSLTTSAFRLLETRHPQGMVIGRHEHERSCVNFVLQGCYREDYAHLSGAFGPQTLVFKPGGEPHANRFLDGSARCLLIELHGAELLPPTVDSTRAASTRDPVAAQAALSIWRELAAPDDLSALSIDQWALELYESTLGEAEKKRAVSSGVGAATETLHDDPRQPWTLTKLARHVGLHPSHLARAFRARHGCTIGEYLRRLRVNEVARRLALHDVTVSALAAELGFADQSHCTRAFRAQFGVTPGAYRRVFRRV